TEVAVLPVHAEVRTYAEDARCTDVADDDFFAIIVLTDFVVLGGIGGLPIDAELTDGQFRQAVLHAQVVAFGLRLAQIGQTIEHLGDVTIGRTHDAGAAAAVAQHIAVTQDAVDAVGDD